MLRVVESPPRPQDDPRLDAWTKEVVELWDAVAQAHRAVSRSDCFKLKHRLESEQEAEKYEEWARYAVKRGRREQIAQKAEPLAIVESEAPGTSLHELGGEYLAQRYVNAFVRAGVRTVESGREALENGALQLAARPGIGPGAIEALREALVKWDDDLRDCSEWKAESDD